MALIRPSGLLRGGLPRNWMANSSRDEEIPVKLLGANTALLISRRILSTYLPVLHPEDVRQIPAGSLDFKGFVLRSWGCRDGRISRQFLIQTLDQLFQSLSQHMDASEAPSLDLADLLERALLSDRQRPSRQARFPWTYQCFASLTEIAARCHSNRINGVLQQFFVKFGTEVAEEERLHTLLDWSTTIIRSGMRDRDIISCLREILLARPQFIEEVGQLANFEQSTRILENFHNLVEIATRLSTGRMALNTARGRGMYRKGMMMRNRRLDPFALGYRRRRQGLGATMLPFRGIPTRRPSDTAAVRRDIKDIKNGMQHLVSEVRQLGDGTTVNSNIFIPRFFPDNIDLDDIDQVRELADDWDLDAQSLQEAILESFRANIP